MRPSERRPVFQCKKRNIPIFRTALPRFLSLLLAILILPLSGCQSHAYPSALSVLEAMTAVEKNCPAGDVYLLPTAHAPAFDPGDSESEAALFFADGELLRSVFGIGDILGNSDEIWQLSPDVIADGAMRLSTAASPAEWIVLLCVNRSDTDAVSELLLHRLDALRRQYHDGDAAATVARGEVYVFDHYVILIIASDPAHSAKHAKEIIY